MAPGGLPSLDMAVIVGRALNTQTPVFLERMEYVVFRPYWNVPLSIVRGEVLPAIARDAEYLARHDMEIVGAGADAARGQLFAPSTVADLRLVKLQIRQRPGPNNALGLVKFVFPNDANIYIHGTPAQELFSRSRRDFSHGCVRVADPVSLAEWVLADQPGWPRERILAAMNGAGPLRVDLDRPIDVALFYTTAAVMPADGTVRFAADIYGHDARLERALADAQSQFRRGALQDAD
jgi:murein L,D-transpeptidase YcbB/YkuD